MNRMESHSITGYARPSRSASSRFPQYCHQGIRAHVAFPGLIVFFSMSMSNYILSPGNHED